MILHYAILDKFIPSFVQLINETFDSALSGHVFLLFGDDQRFPFTKCRNTIFLGRIASAKDLFLVTRKLYAAEKIFLHGLFELRIIIMLALQPWLLRKCYWLIWGHDLYLRTSSKQDFSWRWREFFRSAVIKRVGHLVTYIEGDVALARQWYGSQGTYHECLLYTSNLYYEHGGSSTVKSHLTIQIGNSATSSNEHFSAFEVIRPYVKDNVRVVVPLSYGDPHYGRLVVSRGKELFGNKFIPLTEVMQLDEYRAFLSTVDIAVFNNSRQQGMGNLLTLIGLGKKVYLRPENTAKAFFDKIKVKVFDIDSFNLEPLSYADQMHNRESIRQYCSRENLILQLAELFGGR